jgi:hypothetical protein
MRTLPGSSHGTGERKMRTCRGSADGPEIDAQRRWCMRLYRP